jgi:hypothetical protein
MDFKDKMTYLFATVIVYVKKKKGSVKGIVQGKLTGVETRLK